MKKWLVLFVIGFIVSLALPAWAIECEGAPPSDAGQLIEYITKCNAKINESKGQQQTLNSAITVLNSKINLAQGQINQTQSQTRPGPDRAICASQEHASQRLKKLGF